MKMFQQSALLFGVLPLSSNQIEENGILRLLPVLSKRTRLYLSRKAKVTEGLDTGSGRNWLHLVKRSSAIFNKVKNGK